MINCNREYNTFSEFSGSSWQTLQGILRISKSAAPASSLNQTPDQPTPSVPFSLLHVSPSRVFSDPWMSSAHQCAVPASLISSPRSGPTEATTAPQASCQQQLENSTCICHPRFLASGLLPSRMSNVGTRNAFWT